MLAITTPHGSFNPIPSVISKRRNMLTGERGLVFLHTVCYANEGFAARKDAWKTAVKVFSEVDELYADRVTAGLV